MRRIIFFVVFLLVAVNSVSADTGKKLTNAELKQLTSSMFFAGGYSTQFSVSYYVTWFPNGTREVYSHNGVAGQMVKSKWYILGDTVCVQNQDWALAKCDQWRKNGDRIETWGKTSKNGYFYILR